VKVSRHPGYTMSEADTLGPHGSPARDELRHVPPGCRSRCGLCYVEAGTVVAL